MEILLFGHNYDEINKKSQLETEFFFCFTLSSFFLSIVPTFFLSFLFPISLLSQLPCLLRFLLSFNPLFSRRITCFRQSLLSQSSFNRALHFPSCFVELLSYSLIKLTFPLFYPFPSFFSKNLASLLTKLFRAPKRYCLRRKELLRDALPLPRRWQCISRSRCSTGEQTHRWKQTTGWTASADGREGR